MNSSREGPAERIDWPVWRAGASETAIQSRKTWPVRSVTRGNKYWPIPEASGHSHDSRNWTSFVVGSVNSTFTRFGDPSSTWTREIGPVGAAGSKRSRESASMTASVKGAPRDRKRNWASKTIAPGRILHHSNWSASGVVSKAAAASDVGQRMAKWSVLGKEKLC